MRHLLCPVQRISQGVRVCLSRWLCVSLPCLLFAPALAADEMAAGFQSPPSSVRPRVWWHWMNGNITQDGIEKDLRWMSRIGLGGLQHFDGAWETPQIVPKRLVYMTPEWQEAFRYATTLAEELGLEFAIASSPGWSETGGPWVATADGMKKLVWSEIRVPGGRRFRGALPKPFTRSELADALQRAFETTNAN